MLQASDVVKSVPRLITLVCSGMATQWDARTPLPLKRGSRALSGFVLIGGKKGAMHGCGRIPRTWFGLVIVEKAVVSTLPICTRIRDWCTVCCKGRRHILSGPFLLAGRPPLPHPRPPLHTTECPPHIISAYSAGQITQRTLSIPRFRGVVCVCYTISWSDHGLQSDQP